MQEYNNLLQNFQSIGLKDIESVKLLNRIDRKYVMPFDKLKEIIPDLFDKYYILQVNDVVNSRYSTVYFDTDNFKLYTQHHNGKLNRYKVRTRRYEDSDINFFEIKFKTNTRRTIKKRIQTKAFSYRIDQKRRKFIGNNSNLENEDLKPKINVLYNRATLVSKEFNERLTIDTSLSFENEHDSANFSSLAIIEIKRNRGLKSYADIVLRDNGIHPRSISKYCLGVSSLYEDVKKNNFKLKFNSIKKLCYESI